MMIQWEEEMEKYVSMRIVLVCLFLKILISVIMREGIEGRNIFIYNSNVNNIVNKNSFKFE